ncbi:MAG: hypothetical protein QOJ64_2842 [Acidobacteriota bacterium]|jgi:hypothetical protein|nr:hypothetical protein [Acidobacteriota bacterium]
MKTKTGSVLTAVVAILWSSFSVPAQQRLASISTRTVSTTPNPISIADLLLGIRTLEAAVRRSDGSVDERQTSFTALQAKRVLLYALLRKRVGFLRSYQETVKSPDERIALEKDIANRLGELRELEQGMRRVLADELSVPSPVPATVPAPARPFQQTANGQIRVKVEQLVSNVAAAGTATAKRNAADLWGLNADVVMLAMATRPSGKLIGDIQDIRVDKQIGGGSSNAGSTSLVSKGAGPAILGFAVENGALTQSVSKTIVTYRGNLVGTIEALRNKGFIAAFRDDSPGTKFLRKLSYSFSFDTSQGNLPGTFTANSQQLTGYSFRYEFLNDRDPRGRKYQQRWKDLADKDFQPVLNAIGAVAQDDPAGLLNAWSDKAAAAIAAKGTREEIRKEILRQLDEELPTLDQLTPAQQQAVTQFQAQYEKFLTNRKTLRDVISKGALVTLEFTENRRAGMVDISNFKVIAEGDLLNLFGVGSGRTELTYNGSMTFFNSQPGPGMKRLRDFDHSLQLDFPFIVPNFGSFNLSFAGQYKRMMEDEKMGTTVMNTKGDIAVGQLKFTFPVKGGFKIPLSVTFANRTEFVKEKEVRGNIGFTFDLDSLFARFKPF